MVKLKKWLKKNYFHIICFSITIGFLFCSVFVFSDSAIRVKESFIDLWNSLKYYLKEIFYFDFEATPTVNEYGSAKLKSMFGFPSTLEEFKIKWKLFWQVFITKDNIVEYFSLLGTKLYNFSKIFMLVGLPLILTCYLLFRKFLTTQNNDYNKDSKPLIIYKRIENATIVPVKRFVSNFIQFLKNNSKYYKIWLFIWAWNFNIITIIIEFIAYYFYFVASFELLTIYKQIYKFLCDISTMIAFFPPIIWLVIVYLFVRLISKKIGYKRLNHFESKNCGFISERPIVSMIVGSMGKKKTTILTDMALSEEVIFRNKAYEKLIENDLKFPNFPWINLENTIKMAMEKHIIYNLATMKKFIDLLEMYFYAGQISKSMEKSMRRHLKKVYDIDYSNLIFDYDYKKFGFVFDDKLKVLDIWQVIKTYSQLYFIYVVQSSLLVSNYSIRTDNLFDSVGNFPNWDTDFFKRDSRTIDFISRHSKILDFDSLRLGQKVILENPKADSFEFGVVLITEIGKERKNNLELKELKKSEFMANQKNDGFTDYLKMCRHNSTVDNFPFIKFITDEQRPESLGADARDLCEIIHIKEVGERKRALPFFIIEDILFDFMMSKFLKIYNMYRYNRGDNTLFMYLLKKMMSKFNNYYVGIYNIFGFYKMKLELESGTMTGTLEEKKYYLMTKKVYSKRFSTDCFSDYFVKKTLNSKIGLEDLEEYLTEKASIEELQKQNSYFILDLTDKTKIT